MLLECNNNDTYFSHINNNGGIRMNSNEISVCERMIMKVLWEADEDLDLMTISAKVKEEFGKEWKLQTVATFMTRLKKKGYVSVYRNGRRSHYHPLINMNDFKLYVLSDNISFFSKGNAGAFICGLFDSVELTQEDKEKIRKKIDELG